MNKTYDFSNDFTSNNGIYDAFYAEIAAPALSRGNAARAALEKAQKLHKIITGATAKRLAKVTGATLSILGVVGIAGGIQHGRISLLGGIAVAALCLCLEYACLKSVEK